MRLVAIYIKKHDYLFDKPQTVNFGGKYTYTINQNDANNFIISRNKNINFIDKFWGEKISLISSIVGANATGKTSLLNIINRSYKDETESIFIYESLKGNKVYFFNKINNKSVENNVITATNINIKSIEFEIVKLKDSMFVELYYSSIFDERILDFHSPLKLNSNDSRDTLSDIFQKNILKENIFLSSKTSDLIKSIYSDFPVYLSNVISANRLHKSDIRKVYIDTNIGYGNVLKRFRTDVEWELKRNIDTFNNDEKYADTAWLKKNIQYLDYILKVTHKDVLFKMFNVILKNVFDNESIDKQFKDLFKNDNEDINSIVINEQVSIKAINYSELTNEQKEQFITNLQFLKNLSMVDMLEIIWEDYPNNTDDSHILHSSDNLLKNLEVNILSLLVLKDVYAINGLQGSYDSEKIINEKEFCKRLNHFLRKFIVQKHKTLYDKIVRVLGDGFDVLKEKDEIIKIINQDKFTQENGVNTTKIKQNIIYNVESFYNIIDFYNFIKKNIQNKNDFSFEIKVKDENSTNTLNLFFEKYNYVKDFFSDLPLRDIDLIFIKPDKKFSFGEKMLLNLYSVLYEFSNGYHESKGGNYLLLLDEADLGYHVLWKKKFINAIVKTLPVVFIKDRNLTSSIFDSLNDEALNIQIVFTTHDPLTLSDIPNSNVIYLKKDGFTSIVNKTKSLNKSFGANITDLLADSFFINDGLIGDFAKEKINELIKFFKTDEKIKTSEKKYIKRVIDIIDEPLIKEKLKQKYYQRFPKEFSKNKEIEILSEQANRLGFELKKK